jgi:hypothetical protein
MSAIERLFAAFAETAHNEHAERTQLEDAVCAFVEEMKEQGQPPEAVIIAAKQMAAQAGLVSSPEPSLFFTHDDAGHVLSEIVRWCIEEYYRDHQVAAT